jgi:hypothetical protein
MKIGIKDLIQPKASDGISAALALFYRENEIRMGPWGSTEPKYWGRVMKKGAIFDDFHTETTEVSCVV